MQIYTHALTAAVAGALLFPGNYLAQAACVAGSVAPDLVMGPQMLWDRFIAKRQALTEQPPWLLVLKEIGHSMLLWYIPAFVTAWYAHDLAETVGLTPLEWQLIGLALSFGGILHSLIDLPTHGRGGTDVAKDDPRTLFFPIYIKLQSLFGIWDYRVKTGQVWPPKPFEALVLFACAAALPAVWLL